MNPVENIGSGAQREPAILLQEALHADLELAEAGSAGEMQAGLEDLVDRCTHLLHMIEAGGETGPESLYLRMSAEVLFADAAFRLAMLDSDGSEDSIWTGIALEHAGAAVDIAADVPSTHGAYRVLNRLAELLLPAVSIAGDVRERVTRDLLQRAMEQGDRSLLAITRADRASLEALNYGVFMESLASDFDLPSDRLVMLQTAGRSYAEAMDGFGRVENVEFYSRAEAGFGRMAEQVDIVMADVPEDRPVCAGCGSSLTPGSAFCRSCGAKV